MRLNRDYIIRTHASRRRGSAFVSVLLGFSVGLLAQCRARGLAPGSPCTSPIQCEYAICEQGFRPDGSAETVDGRTVGTCATRCESSSNCPASFICGRGDFRGIELDSGLMNGPEHEVVRTCRPSMARECTSDVDCQGSQRCLLPAREGHGVCASPCTQNSQCGATVSCLRDELTFSCGSAGLCAPRCDDRLECPTGWRCELGFSNAVFGRCQPVLGIEAGCGDSDAGVDASEDAADAPAAMTDAAFGDAFGDASAPQS